MEKLGVILQYFYVLYNKNILEYANIVVTEPNSRICYTEDHSIEELLNQKILLNKKRHFFKSLKKPKVVLL